MVKICEGPAGAGDLSLSWQLPRGLDKVLDSGSTGLGGRAIEVIGCVFPVPADQLRSPRFAIVPALVLLGLAIQGWQTGRQAWLRAMVRKRAMHPLLRPLADVSRRPTSYTDVSQASRPLPCLPITLDRGTCQPRYPIGPQTLSGEGLGPCENGNNARAHWLFMPSSRFVLRHVRSTAVLGR